jgi:tetratricopeptide (TPR) repeat protein
MEAANEAIKLAPQLPEAWMYRACAHRLRNQLGNALDDVRKALQLDAEYAPIYVELSCIHRELGQYDEAIAWASKALELAPSIQRARTARGWSYALKGDFDKALVDYDEEIRRFPLEAAEYVYRAAIHAKKGDLEAAKADRDRAVKLDPAQANTWVLLPDKPTLSANPAESPRDRTPIAWGKPSPNGMQLGIELEPRKSDYELVERVKVRLLLRNAGKEAIHMTLPRLEVLEKFGVDLSLRHGEAKEVGWSWGGAHKPKDLWTVSGAVALPLAPGGTYELPAMHIGMGFGAPLADVMARLNIEANQSCRFSVKLQTYSYARGQGEPLESGVIEFTVR